MANRRLARLNEQLKREISEVIRTELRDPRIGSVVVTAVDTTADLFMSRVHVRPMGDDEARDLAVEGLEAAAPYIRRELSQRLPMRRVPEIHFELDLTLERALRIEEILGDVRPEGGWPDEEEEESDELESVQDTDDLEDTRDIEDTRDVEDIDDIEGTGDVRHGGEVENSGDGDGPGRDAGA